MGYLKHSYVKKGKINPTITKESLNVLLASSPINDVLLDIQVTLSQALQDLKVHGYQQTCAVGMKQEPHVTRSHVPCIPCQNECATHED